MKKRINITGAEWAMLEILWQESPLSAREVYERLPTAERGSLQTVRTLLERLLKKCAVARSDAHGVWIFEPCLERQDAVRREGLGFIERFFGGRPAMGAAYFIEESDLLPEELNRLKTLLESKLAEAKKHDN